jgi:hypothetical protein
MAGRGFDHDIYTYLFFFSFSQHCSLVLGLIREQFWYTCSFLIGSLQVLQVINFPVSLFSIARWGKMNPPVEMRAPKSATGIPAIVHFDFRKPPLASQEMPFPDHQRSL